MSVQTRTFSIVLLGSLALLRSLLPTFALLGRLLVALTLPILCGRTLLATFALGLGFGLAALSVGVSSKSLPERTQADGPEARGFDVGGEVLGGCLPVDL